MLGRRQGAFAAPAATEIGCAEGGGVDVCAHMAVNPSIAMLLGPGLGYSMQM